MSGQFQQSFIYRFVNTLVGGRAEFFFALSVSGGMGFAYAFRIWDQPAVLFVFGMALPSFYIVGLYKFMKLLLEQPQVEEVPEWAKKGSSGSLFIIIDVVITNIVGVLIFLGFFDYVFLRLLLTFIFPLFYILGLNFFINIFRNQNQ